MNAIKIIDEMIEEPIMLTNPIEMAMHNGRIKGLRELRDKISSLPSDTQWIDTLQRLSFFGEFMAEDKDGRYIRYDDLVELLNR